MPYVTTLNFLSEVPVLGGKEAIEATLCLLITEVELTKDSLRITWAVAGWDTIDLDVASDSVILLDYTVSFKEQISLYCLFKYIKYTVFSFGF